MKRTLRLRKEVLAELSTAELSGVVGAGSVSGPTCVYRDCGYSQDFCPTQHFSCIPTGCNCITRQGCL